MSRRGSIGSVSLPQVQSHRIVQPSQCRFLWHPYVLAFLLTSSLTLSILSTLDCQFLRLIVDFNPTNTQFLFVEPDAISDTNNSTKRDPTTAVPLLGGVGVGLWSYASPYKPDQCLFFSAAHIGRGVSYDDDNYSSYFTNADTSWSVSRVTAVIGILAGIAAVVIVWWKFLCTTSTFSREVLLQITTLTFLCEGVKFGVFFNIGLCTCENVWKKSDGSTHPSNECDLSRGSYASIASLITYFVCMILICGFLTRPKNPKHEISDEDIMYDNVSLPSCMQSLGQSVNTKETMGSKKSAGSDVSKLTGLSSTSGGSKIKISPRNNEGSSRTALTQQMSQSTFGSHATSVRSSNISTALSSVEGGRTSTRGAASKTSRRDDVSAITFGTMQF